MESLCKRAGRAGLSGMDAARAAMGQGRPFAACPWSNDGTKEVWRRSRQARMPGALSLWLLSLCANKEKVTRREGEKLGFSISRNVVRLRWRTSEALSTLRISKLLACEDRRASGRFSTFRWVDNAPKQEVADEKPPLYALITR